MTLNNSQATSNQQPVSKISYIFPGQGAQEVGMGREFYEQSSHARAIFDAADKVIPNLKDVIFNGPSEKLTSTAYCQPAIFTFSVAALKAFEAHPNFAKVKPTFAAGLSLGEYAALVASGTLSFEETLRLVERRSTFMDEATKLQKGAMAAVIGFEKEKLVALCRENGAQVANFNSPDQIVITGEANAVAKASEAIKNAGAKRVIPLDVAGAFHSTLMKPAADKFVAELAKANFVNGKIPVLGNVDGRPASDPQTMRQKLAQQITASVQWIETVHYMAAQGTTTFLEIGPGTVLKGLIRKINPELKVFSIQKPSDIDALVI